MLALQAVMPDLRSPGRPAGGLPVHPGEAGGGGAPELGRHQGRGVGTGPHRRVLPRLRRLAGGDRLGRVAMASQRAADKYLVVS
jgi:hypothetical protein